MKHLTFLFTLLLNAFSLPLFAQSAKVVIEKQTGEVYLYHGESNTHYHAEAQDYFWIHKSKAVVKTYSAANGQGFIIPNDIGTVNVREKPNKNSRIVGKLVFEDGMYPEAARCLGKVEGWYKVKTYSDKIGYVRGDLVDWSAINLF